MSPGRRSISAPEELLLKGEVRAAQLGYSKFSQYIAALIKADCHFGDETLYLHERVLRPPNSTSAEHKAG